MNQTSVLIENYLIEQSSFAIRIVDSETLQELWTNTKEWVDTFLRKQMEDILKTYNRSITLQQIWNRMKTRIMKNFTCFQYDFKIG